MLGSCFRIRRVTQLVDNRQEVVENTIDCNGMPMTVDLLEVMLRNLNEHGQLHIKNLRKGSVSMLELGAVLCTSAARENMLNRME